MSPTNPSRGEPLHSDVTLCITSVDGLDSIDDMLLMMQIEDQFEIIIMDHPEPELDDYFQVTTVGDAIEYILRRMHGPQSPKTTGIL